MAEFAVVVLMRSFMVFPPNDHVDVERVSPPYGINTASGGLCKYTPPIKQRNPFRGSLWITKITY